jgi:hypothetical protein
VALSNVEVVRRAVDSFADRDVDALSAWLTEDVELRSAIIGNAEGNVYRGHEGCASGRARETRRSTSCG